MVHSVMMPPKTMLGRMEVRQTTANSMMEATGIPHLAGCCEGREVVPHGPPRHPRGRGDLQFGPVKAQCGLPKKRAQYLH